MLKIVLYLLLMIMAFLSSSNSYSANGDVSVIIDPQIPIVGESFNVIFTIESSSSSDPYISFEPGDISVQGKQNLGVSISTTLINGRFSTKRTMRVGYEMIVERSGIYTIRDIKVDINGNIVEVKNVRFKALKTPPRPKNIFVRAEVSKESAYLGEAIDVKYYLYFLVPVSATEIKAFPKLKRFLKRFHMIKERIESVEFEGRVYKRILKYSARVYPTKVGKLIIDPLKLVVQYGSEASNSPFSNFGLRLRNYKTNTFSSRPIKISVLALPAENVPPDFTGLIGRHSFTLISNRERFLVNEPIEIKLEVKGAGALENLESPEIYSHPSLEKFDTKSELLELNRNISRKVFEYTYLARNSFQIKETVKSFSFFDPEDQKYKSVDIKIPSMLIGGAVTSGNSNKKLSEYDTENNNRDEKESKTKKIPKLETMGLVAPIFQPVSVFQFKNMLKFFNIIVCLFIGYLLWVIYFKKRIVSSALYKTRLAINNIKKNGISYSNIFTVVDYLNSKKSDNLTDVIDQSELSSTAKEYFVTLLINTERVSFKDSNDVRSGDLLFDDKHFKEIYKLIERELS
ncbi:MAG: hypothetical protein HN576_02085 [Bacteriovoracaceae bacterium]|jgi:hypothetical protein|nr:hypothetical protein [Bacteriovoracaceae bacterium]